MRIAVMGAGSMGSIIGALISKGGLDVVLIDVNEEHVQAMNERGLKIIGHMEETIPVKAITPAGMEGVYDLVIFLPKATANEVALNSLLPHIGPESVVLTLQNGVNEDAVAAVVGAERTCGGIMLWGATWKEPAVSELTTTQDQMEIIIGEVDGSTTDRIQNIKRVLENVCKIEATGELMSHKWSKLYINAAFSGVGTVIGGDYGAVIDNKLAANAAVYVGMETVKTAKALDMARVKFMFMEPDQFVFDEEEKLANIIAFFKNALKPHRNIYPSMLQDIEKGRPCEVEVINGYVQKKAKETGVPSPVNDQVTDLIREIEKGERKASTENLEVISFPPIKRNM